MSRILLLLVLADQFLKNPLSGKGECQFQHPLPLETLMMMNFDDNEMDTKNRRFVPGFSFFTGWGCELGSAH